MIERFFSYLEEHAFKQAEENQRRLSQLGSEVRIIKEKGNPPNLNKVLERSLLGIRLRLNVNVEELNEVEKNLINKEPKILVICDFDGVVTDILGPIKALLAIWRNNSHLSLKEIIEVLRKEGRIGFENLRWLARLAKASDLLVISTSRFFISDEVREKCPFFGQIFAELFEGKIAYFPFLDQTSITHLERLGRDRLIVGQQKPLIFFRGDLNGLIDLVNNYDMIYYIGSSERDRKSARVFLEKYPQMASRFVFFDTVSPLA